MALTSFASESSANSATKKTTCIRHSPGKSSRFWRVYWSSSRKTMWRETYPSPGGPCAGMSWNPALTYRKELFLPTDYHCLWKSADGQFLISSSHEITAPCCSELGGTCWSLKFEYVLSFTICKPGLLLKTAAAERLVCVLATALSALCLPMWSFTQRKVIGMRQRGWKPANFRDVEEDVCVKSLSEPSSCRWDCTFVVPNQFIQGATTGS